MSVLETPNSHYPQRGNFCVAINQLDRLTSESGMAGICATSEATKLLVTPILYTYSA